MTQYSNENRGSLSKNKRKEQDNHPDYTGSINVDGRDYWLNGWLKTNGQTGEKFFSLSVKPKEATSMSMLVEKPQGGRTPGKAPIDLDDEIPFEMPWK
jgi:uncharacterized protein (DUF736 family)